MRMFPIALAAVTLAIPSVGYSQDQGLVGSRVEPNLGSSSPTHPGSSVWARPYGSPSIAPQERAGYAGVVTPGQVAPGNVSPVRRPGGLGTAFVGGHRVLVDPNTNRIMRVFN